MPSYAIHDSHPLPRRLHHGFPPSSDPLGAHGTWTTKGTDLAMAALTSVPRIQRYGAEMREKRRKMNKDESKQSENWCKYRTKQIQTVSL